LLSSRPDVIVATPGRLAHHLTEIPDFSLSSCQMCVLDEADRLLEMGFGMQIRAIARTFPGEGQCQKVLLSATMPKQLVEFTRSGFAVDPAVVRLDQEATVSANLRMAFITCRSMEKDAALLHVLRQIRQDLEKHKAARTGLTLIFAATRHHCEYITTLLTASGTKATMIYGTLDQEARKQHLSAFRSGQTPVLVVTDVAARGIDVPLIDHVIHYHFPAQPKLFVHRSGRAARAGRVGYCWSLTEPDELPYMMDLHLFLGRKPTTAVEQDLSYALQDMTPDDVHYGSLPESVATEEIENVQRVMNSELSGSRDAQSLRALTKVCNNAMKQYRKTRSEASREGVRRAKAVLEGEKLKTGQRVSGGAIPPHPLFRATAVADAKPGELAAVDNVKKREEFLRAMSNFRPKETVFEAFATGKTREAGVVSHLDKGRTVSSKKKNDSSAALSAIKDMRRQMRIARDKGTALVVAGSETAVEGGGEEVASEPVEIVPTQVDEETDTKNAESSLSAVNAALVAEPEVAVHAKRRMSRAERRQLKKNPHASSNSPACSSTGSSKSKKVKRGSDFRDPAFFIDNDFTSNSEEANRSRLVEAAMQPSASASGSAGTALRIEEAMLDIVGDENDELVRKQRMMRWDKSKRKYVQTSVGEELSGDSKSKKLRLESGQLVKNNKLKLGELYTKWQKKTNRSVGRTGVFDDDGGDAVETQSRRYKKKKGRPAGNDRVKTSAAIKKDREKKQNMKIKNMKKSERRHVEQKQREEKNSRSRKRR
jgi:ATP-dependent RNA helicase DDX54/DBP10